VPFERYADDAICHCHSEREALALRQALDWRFGECGLVLHPEKTKVVYCKDTNRKREHSILQFDFLGYTFRTAASEVERRTVRAIFSPGSQSQGFEGNS
jgi:hypothetical protein